MSESVSEESFENRNYRMPSSESFLKDSKDEIIPSPPSNEAMIALNSHVSEPSANFHPPSEPSQVASDNLPEVAALQTLCLELLALAERLADDGAPDRATHKEKLFLLGQQIHRKYRPQNFRQATPHTARLLREAELPSSSSMMKFPISSLPDFDFPRIREFLAQHGSSRYAPPLLRALIHHCTWNFLEIYDRRAFLLSLVAFDVFGGAPAVLPRLLESGTSEAACALISVLACEWAGRAYLARFSLLPLVQTFFRCPIDSPVFMQALAALQRLSFNPEIGNFLLDCQLHEFLLVQVLGKLHSEFSSEFSLALISNLADLPGFGISDQGMNILRDQLRKAEIFIFEIFQKILGNPGMKDTAFAAGVDAELERLAVESENSENFRQLLDLLHGPSRVSSATKVSDSPGLCFLEDEDLAQLVIGNSLASETFVTKRFVRTASVEESAFFGNFIEAVSAGKFPTAEVSPAAAPKTTTRGKPKIWR